MSDLCLDANIIIAALSPDENGAVSRNLINQVLGQKSQIWAPALINFEVSGAFARKETLGFIKKIDTAESLQVLFELPLLLMWNHDLVELATEIGRATGLYFYDSCYLAVAVMKNLPLITGDKDFIKKGRKYYRGIFHPVEFGR